MAFPPAAAADETMVANGIAEYWSGKIGKYNVSVNLSLSGAPPIDMTMIPKKKNGNLGGEGGSYGRPWSGSPMPLGGEMHIVEGNSSAVTMVVAAHEFGHVMHLGHQGGMNDLMHRSYDVNVWVAGVGTNRRQRRSSGFALVGGVPP